MCLYVYQTHPPTHPPTSAFSICVRQSNPPTHPPTHHQGFTPSIEPRMFKTLIGKHHPEFSSGRQQDAKEYLEHLLTKLVRAERAGQQAFSTDSLFK